VKISHNVTMLLFSTLLSSHPNTIMSNEQSSYSNVAPFLKNSYPN